MENKITKKKNSSVKKSKPVKYEKISLEDILNEDEF